MEDDSAAVIWRCQYRSASQVKTYLKAALNMGDAAKPYQAKRDLKVLFECRPYELGWLLYAFAARTSQPVPAHTEKYSIAVGQNAPSGKR
jgi:hypothetical protein